MKKMKRQAAAPINQAPKKGPMAVATPLRPDQAARRQQGRSDTLERSGPHEQGSRRGQAAQQR
jgi:hypothetical protein